MNKQEALKQIEELKKYVEDLDSAGEVQDINHGDVFKSCNNKEVVCYSWSDGSWIVQEEDTFFLKLTPFRPYLKQEMIKFLNEWNYKLVGRAKVVVEKI